MRADLALIFFLLSLGGGIVLLALRKNAVACRCSPVGSSCSSARLRWRCIWQRQCCWCWLCAEKRKNIIGFHRYLKTAP